MYTICIITMHARRSYRLSVLIAINGNLCISRESADSNYLEAYTCACVDAERACRRAPSAIPRRIVEWTNRQSHWRTGGNRRKCDCAIIAGENEVMECSSNGSGGWCHAVTFYFARTVVHRNTSLALYTIRRNVIWCARVFVLEGVRAKSEIVKQQHHHHEDNIAALNAKESGGIHRRARRYEEDD